MKKKNLNNNINDNANKYFEIFMTNRRAFKSKILPNDGEEKKPTQLKRIK